MSRLLGASRKPALLRAALGLGLMASSAMLAGCQTGATVTNQSLFDQDYAKRHPIVISNEPETLDIPVGMNGGALSPQLRVAIRDYLRTYRAAGTGGLTIQVPTGAANDIAAAQTGKAVHYALLEMGVSRMAIRLAPYPVNDPAVMGVLRVSYLKVKATTPKCGIWPEDLGAHSDNRDVYDFGCATQSNLAAMLADPADVVRPRALEPANGARRANIISGYEEGAASKASTSGGS